MPSPNQEPPIYRYKLASQRLRVNQAFKDAAYGKIDQAECGRTLVEIGQKLQLIFDPNQMTMEYVNADSLEVNESE